MANQIRVRIAPSPTGTLHIGTSRVALYNYLFAKQNNGKFILRIDDTDTERSRKEYEEDIISGLAWVGLKYDEIYHQSERTNLYKTKLQQLIDSGAIYISQETAEKEGDRSEVIRFKNPNKKVVFKDMIRGLIEFDTTELGDFIIAKDLETPLYHFASVVDDIDLGITHIIRGEDHISNTPRQILMIEALGGMIPEFAHLPLILAPDKSKLSKRKHASLASVSVFIEKGYLPEALINFIVLLGWSPQSVHIDGQEQAEILSLSEMLKLFSLEKVQKSGAVFNEEKLKWINKEYIKRLSSEQLFTEIKKRLPEQITDSKKYSDARLEKILPLIAEHIHTFGEVTTMAEAGELGYFFDTPNYDKALLKTTEFLPEVIRLIEDLHEDNFTMENIKAAIWDYATEKGRGQVLWPMRVALTGQEKSPDPFIVASILGKDETLVRLRNALS